MQSDITVPPFPEEAKKEGKKCPKGPWDDRDLRPAFLMRGSNFVGDRKYYIPPRGGV